MSNTFKKVIDRLAWCQVAPSPNTHAAGQSLCSDLRSDVSRNPFVYQLVSNTIMNRFNIVTKSWGLALNPALAGTFGAGAFSCFAPSRGLEGLLLASTSNTSVSIGTDFATSVGVNMLANRGGSGEYGYKIRIIGKIVGKTEERFITSNSGGTKPVIGLDSPLSFIPSADDVYEVLGGRVFMHGSGTNASGSFKSMEMASNTLSIATYIPVTPSTDSSILALDEQYTPFDTEPGEGFVHGTYQYDSNLTTRHALEATNSDTNKIYGQVTLGDSSVVDNEYRGFQIRIVEDQTTPLAVGQRRIISSNTAGVNGVSAPCYTLSSNWTVTPSTSAKYVIEYPNILLVRCSASASVYVYNYNKETIYSTAVSPVSLLSGAWSTTWFPVAPAVHAVGGFFAPSYGIRPDDSKNSRHSFIYWFRGGNTSNVDMLDIAGPNGGTWSPVIVYDGNSTLFTTGSCTTYAPYANDGRFMYINSYVSSATNQIHRFDVKNRVMVPFTPTDWIQSGTGVVGNRMASYCAFDGTDKYDVILLQSMISTIAQEMIPLV